MEPLAPRIPTTEFVEGVLVHLEGLPHWGRRLFIKRRMPGQYPRFLYKYASLNPEDNTSVDRMRDLVVRSHLWLSDHERFNDPFDLTANIVLVGTERQWKERFKALIANQSNARHKERRALLKEFMARPQADWEASIKAIFKERARQVGICSFADDPRSILMWGHYGHHHEGLCLQFEYALDPRIFSMAQKVEYANEYPTINYIGDLAGQILIPLTRKYLGWKYEGEWRVLHLTGANTSLPFDARALKRIVIGCRASEKVQLSLEALLHDRRDKGLPEISLFRAERHPSAYKLLIKKISTPVLAKAP